VAGAAVAMGGGAIWSMHFIAMIACRLPVPVTYDVTLTLASLFVAIVVTGAGLYTVGRGVSSVGRLLAGGVFTGLGVAGMHYTGMAAMHLPASTTYRPVLVAASVLIAIVAATAALWIAFNMRGGLQRLLSSLVMGSAVCGMHYTAMAAAVFTPTDRFAVSPDGVLKSNDLGFMVFGITLFVLVLLSMGSRIIERMQTEERLRRAHDELERQVAERTAELASANDFLRQVINTNPNLIFAKDREGRFTLVNQAVADAYGTTIEELVGKRDADFNSKADEVEPFLEADREVMDSLCEKRIPEERVTDSTGKVRWLQTVKRPIIGHDGTANQILGVATDITERKELEGQLRQSQKMEAIGTLAGGVAHDFNNLLTPILGYSELLLGAMEADSPFRVDVAEIKRAGERAASLTRQLLAFSRKQLVELRVLDLKTIIADFDKMLRRLVGEDIELVTLTDPLLGHVKADRGQIDQILMNLAVNARDAMPRGGKLTIESRNVDLEYRYARENFQIEPGPYVMLAVSDTGTGMDAETRARIFEPFFTTKEKGRGTGLGLSTVYGIVKQSGGYIWVDTEPGLGAGVKIYLPRVDLEVSRIQPTDLPRSLSGKETILLVEDEEAVRRLTSSVLSRHGYTVLEACNGEEAMRIAAEGDGGIDLVLTDGVMPGMAVGDLVAGIRSARPQATILVMSGYTGEAIIRRGILELDIPFLEKPFTSTALLRKVRDVLDAQEVEFVPRELHSP
jgi:PAS domain S-box-containing protein